MHPGEKSMEPMVTVLSAHCEECGIEMTSVERSSAAPISFRGPVTPDTVYFPVTVPARAIQVEARCGECGGRIVFALEGANGRCVRRL